MRQDKITNRTQEAVQSALGLAATLRHQQLEPEHLLAAMLAQGEGLATPLLARAGVTVPTLIPLDEYRKHIEKDAALERRFQPVLIGEPSVADTISILRGIKERYALHHGVRITDGALVAAATLSARYITDRFLPDKAIDLMDEAAAQIRMEITSKPREVDEIDRKILQLQIERTALAKESDPASRERLRQLERELANLDEESARLNALWQGEKAKIAGVQIIKERLEAHRTALDQAERQGDLARASELKYGVIPPLERELDAALLASQASLDHGAARLLREEVGEAEIAAIVAHWTGIPVSRMLEGERAKLLRMEAELGQRVVGQEEALSAVARAVRRARAGLQDPRRPIGTFMFLGPTGVGKTELSKVLAEFLFDDQRAMIRLDMSEYMEKHTVSRLVGAPPGYVGYEEGGQLTEAVRRRPYSVILLDEIEKAHPQVFNILLQLMDDGRLTDGQGRTVDFRNTVVIMTSNVGSAHIGEYLAEQDYHLMRARVLVELGNVFRPEFLNRVDEVVIFHRLNRGQMNRIVEIQLDRLRHLLDARQIQIALNATMIDRLAGEGFDPVFGARPLRRVMQRLVLDPMAEAMLAGQIKDGDAIRVAIGDEGTQFILADSSEIPT